MCANFPCPSYIDSFEINQQYGLLLTNLPPVWWRSCVLVVGSADPTAFLETPFYIFIFVYSTYLSTHSDPIGFSGWLRQSNLSSKYLGSEKYY
jgi:hypothetical protein